MVTLTSSWEKAVVRWECAHVDPMDRSRVCARVAAAVAQHALSLAQVPHKAPVVTYVGPDDPGYIAGAAAAMYPDGLRMDIFQREVRTSTVLHEIAHLLTEDPLDCMELRRLNERPMHGPLFLQNYLWLLGRLMGPAYNPFYLRGTMPAVLSPGAIPLHPCVWGRQRTDLA